MENNDSNIKPKQTGGLKLMTVFIVVLVLHVVVIGSFTAYNLMKGGSADADLVTTDKTHKDLKDANSPAITDTTATDEASGDKSVPAPTAPAEVATIPANPTTPAPDQTVTAAPVPAPAPVAIASAPATPAQTAPASAATPSEVTQVTQAGTGTQIGPIAPELVPPPEPTQAPMAATPAPALVLTPAPTAPVAAGPVHMPAVTATAPAPAKERIYVVKITDSYKKIAHAHHITVAELKEANHIKGDVLHTGQKLIIPSEKPLVAATTPATALDAVPTPEETAPTARLVSATSTETTAVSHAHVYTVVKGDTLVKIAHRFRTTPSAIMTANSITDPTKLAIGKKLRIPSGETRSARNATPAPVQPEQVQAQPDQVQTQSEEPSGQLANFVP
ncbi:MAG: LysM peptidoglycan-binding domain-containing protein [Methylacidiphilales bacterium]|nr:LysM peptidoglycan-binding domain-containing protein [Candidatus Methylacidiphilales bacterium]